MMPATNNENMTNADDFTLDSREAKAEADKKSKARVYTEFALPSERVDKDKHMPLLKNAVALSQFGKVPVTAEQMEQGVSAQAARLTVNFFVEVGLLSKTDRKYLPTQACIDLVRAYALGDVQKARTVLRGLLAPTWFAEGVLARLAVDRRAPEGLLVNQLAVTAGVIDEKDQKTKARSFRILLAYLIDAGLIAKEGEEYVLVEESGNTPDLTTPQGQATLGTFTPPSPQMVSVPVVQPSVQTATPARPVSNAPTPQPTPMQPAPEGWLSRSTPGFYELRVKPDPRALRMLEAVLAELRITVEITQENEKMKDNKTDNSEA